MRHDVDSRERGQSQRETYVAFGFKRVRVNTFRVTEVHIVV